jgi:hypothetical protein
LNGFHKFTGEPYATSKEKQTGDKSPAAQPAERIDSHRNLLALPMDIRLLQPPASLPLQLATISTTLTA